MAIPEHNKCVAFNKRRKCDWRRVRAIHIHRKNDRIKLKMRIRQMLNVELEMQKSRIRKTYGIGYTEFIKSVIGEHYRRWGKYDD